MTAATLRLDLEAARLRTRWTMSTSLVAHALLFLILILHRVATPDLEPITEITLIEPRDLASSSASSPASPAPASPAPAGRPREGLDAATRSTAEAHFKRPTPKAEVEPNPMSSWSFEDRLQARLAAMQQNATQGGSGIATTKTPTSIFGSSPATVSSGTGIGTPMTLNRGGTGGGSPLPLARGTGSGSAPSLATVHEGRGGGGEAPAPARGGSEGVGRRTVAGASITGPIADRPIVSYSVPVYPEWAKHDGVEGSVTLYFVVLPSGTVKENVLVQKTAGFEDFDESARVALRAWRFKALSPSQTGEQWGSITFRFRLRDAG